MKWCFIVVLIFISLVTYYYVGHLSYDYLPFMSSLVRYMIKSLVQVLMGLFVFLLLSFRGPLHILDNSPLSDMLGVSVMSDILHLQIFPPCL